MTSSGKEHTKTVDHPQNFYLGIQCNVVITSVALGGLSRLKT